MLFQGQEFASSAPFLYFADHKAELRGAGVAKGGGEFLRAVSERDRPGRAGGASGAGGRTRRSGAASSISRSASGTGTGVRAAPRSARAAPRGPGASGPPALARPDGAVLAPQVFVLRYLGGADGRSAAGRQPRMRPRPQPGARAAAGAAGGLRAGVVHWSSEAPRYGGGGTPPFDPHSDRGTCPARRRSFCVPSPGDRRRLDVETTTMPDVTRAIARPQDRLGGDEPPPRREWLVTNGLGGYASGTVAGVVTRRYHGLLVASLPAPLGRHGDAQSPAGARPPAGPQRRRGSATRTTSPVRTPPTAPSTSSSSGSSSACRSGAIELRRRRDREARR